MANLDYHEPVSKLLTFGDASKLHSWPDYLALGLGLEDVPDLIRMMQDEELYQADSESLEVWAPVHAWRALGQLRAEAAIEPLVGLLEQMDEAYEEWIGEEVPVVLGLIGPAAMPAARDCLLAEHQDIWAQAMAGNALKEIALHYPEVRDEIVATLSGALERFANQDRSLNAFLVGNLIDLQAVEAAPLMEQAFAASRVDIATYGDWEDVQIDLGLLDERQTPAPQYVQLPGLLDLDLEWGQPSAHLLSNPKSRQPALPGQGQRWKVERKAGRRQRDKRKAQRKQQKQARRKQRKQ